MRIDLLRDQRLTILLPGGDELHLTDTAGATTLDHVIPGGPAYSFHIPSPMEPDSDQQFTEQQEEPTPPPAAEAHATEENQARLFF